LYEAEEGPVSRHWNLKKIVAVDTFIYDYSWYVFTCINDWFVNKYVGIIEEI